MTALACLDAETTGTDPAADRIVSLAVVRVAPDGTRSTRSWRLNPGVPIGASATAVHGITDADVADCPRFADYVLSDRFVVKTYRMPAYRPQKPTT